MGHFTALEKDFHRYYIDVLRRCEEEDVHQLRVNMKRQVAFFHLLEFLDGSFSTERALEAYGKLYKRAGKVRDYQVLKSVIQMEEEQLKLQHQFSEWLNEKERQQREKLTVFEEEQSMIPVRRLGKLVKNRIRFLPEQELKERLRIYFVQLFDRIRASLHPENHTEKKFHELRKRIKELFFNLNLINGICTRGKIYKRELKALDNFQKLLGQWHDRYFTLERLANEQGKCPDEVIDQMKKERLKYVRQIMGRLGKIPAMIDRLELAVGRVFEIEPIEKSPKAEGKLSGSATHPSFSQINVSEETK